MFLSYYSIELYKQLYFLNKFYYDIDLQVFLLGCLLYYYKVQHSVHLKFKFKISGVPLRVTSFSKNKSEHKYIKYPTHELSTKTTSKYHPKTLMR